MLVIWDIMVTERGASWAISPPREAGERGGREEATSRQVAPGCDLLGNISLPSYKTGCLAKSSKESPTELKVPVCWRRKSRVGEP